MMRRMYLFVVFVAATLLLGSISATEPRDTTFVLPGGASIEMVWIDPGTFMMGTTEEQEQLLRDKEMWWDDLSEDEHPAHSVTITRGFWLGKYELTQGQWESVMRTRPWAGKDYILEISSYPVVYISWNDVQKFIRKLNNMEGSAVYRLPTEAEWEYACRAGTTTLWWFENDEEKIGQYAWYYNNTWDVGELYAHEVGTKLPNPWGLYDMYGNVSEWVQDWYGSYSSNTEIDPTGPSTGSGHIIRGGGLTSYAHGWSADRTIPSPCGRGYGVGARLVRDVLLNRNKQ